MKTLFTLALTAFALSADNPNRNFEVTFNDCREFVGFGPIPIARAQSALPAGFTAASAGPAQGGIVVRAASCQAVSVAGSVPAPGIVAHYGINITSPDSTGDINNYTLRYAASSEKLADQLRKTGLPAVYNPALAFEIPPAGNLYAGVFGDGLQPYAITGQLGPHALGPFPFTANWWYSSKTGRVKMATVIPSIDFDSASLVVRTATSSPLGQLLGGNAYSNFPFFNIRGTFLTGQMSVTTTR